MYAFYYETPVSRDSLVVLNAQTPYPRCGFQANVHLDVCGDLPQNLVVLILVRNPQLMVSKKLEQIIRDQLPRGDHSHSSAQTHMRWRYSLRSSLSCPGSSSVPEPRVWLAAVCMAASLSVDSWGSIKERQRLQHPPTQWASATVLNAPFVSLARLLLLVPALVAALIVAFVCFPALALLRLSAFFFSCSSALLRTRGLGFLGSPRGFMRALVLAGFLIVLSTEGAADCASLATDGSLFGASLAGWSDGWVLPRPLGSVGPGEAVSVGAALAVAATSSSMADSRSACCVRMPMLPRGFPRALPIAVAVVGCPCFGFKDGPTLSQTRGVFLLPPIIYRYF